ncbi:MAG: ketoacyl-ACP synthase III [Bacteroidales bacterium]|jgi:3-oxoacyl-[acyl-carrier-protein] synthase-3|nr:ketoacyl-ACP synthase III [Bacteroidales bacterium]
MDFKFQNKKITGILSILPDREVYFEDEMGNYNFSTAKSLKLKMAMGYNKKRIVEEGVCSSDLCIHGLSYLFEVGKLEKEDIDALVLVTQSGDYIMPPTSNLIQGYFGLKEDMICLDINQGCAGYILGLIQAFMLLDLEAIKKVVLLNADVLSPKVSKKDRNSNPLIGDAAAITIVEISDDENIIFGNIKMNGAGAMALNIPAGGARLPSSPKTAILEEDINGNLRSKDHLVMKGDEVFNFVQKEVPPMIESLLVQANVTRDDIDYYMFHQPNRFMLQKLADKIGVSRDKIPSNIVENFGNSSGVTIPLNISYNLGENLTKHNFKLCLAGFGVGLTWGSLLLDMNNLKFNEIIYY